MINNILIAEDHETSNLSIQHVLKEMSLRFIQAYYCDDALKLLEMGLRDRDQFDLLVTDISFDDDGQTQLLKDGCALITAAKKLQPGLKILVFSAENRPAKIEEFYNNYGIDGFVRKARHDAQELRAALQLVTSGRKYFPPGFRQQVAQSHGHEFSELDINVLMLIAAGKLVKDIPLCLQDRSVFPNKLSSVEKRLKLMRDTFGFHNNEQLLIYCKEQGII